jgi:signal transduction histidine kinase/CheY-like chemotaxis protein
LSGLPPAFEGDVQARQAMLRERVLLLARQSVGAVAAVLMGSLLIALVLAQSATWLTIAAWIGAFMLPNAWRVAYSRRLLRGDRPADERALLHYLGVAAYNGAWTGALPLAFFGSLPQDARVALTVVTLLAATAGAATFASYGRAYLVYLLLAMPPLLYEWAIWGGGRAWIVPVTLLVFVAIMVRLSRHLGELFERSVVIRFEREEVVRQLQREKLETERARRQAEEASLAKSRFLANASHDLRQPAHALGLFTTVLEQTAQTPQHLAIARNISAASRVLGELLDNLLDISRLDAGAVPVCPQPVRLTELLRQLHAEAAQMARGTEVDVRFEADDIVVLIDPVLTERALRNLLVNAVKFTSSGSIRLKGRAVDGRLLLTVEDTGCGIAPDQQSLVFEEFYQIGNTERDHRRGLGLGLSIVTRLAALMGGEVELASTPGRGSRFTLKLPLRLAPVHESAAALKEAQRIDLRGTRVLVVDDESLVREGMRDLLASWGADVDAADGLVAARRCAADRQGRSWDLCLCDLRLRDGEDGVETARQLRADHPAMPIVLVTGDTAPQRIEEATASGLPLLHKPVAAGELAKVIRESIRR